MLGLARSFGYPVPMGLGLLPEVLGVWWAEQESES